MLNGLFIASLISNCYQAIKDACTPTIPAEKWANKDLIHKDIMEGRSDQLIKNAHNGKYVVTETYPEPHRDPKTGKIIIENCELWKKDVRDYGAYQVSKWVKQGKYNLSPEELKKQEEEHKKKMDYLYGLL